MDGLTNLRLHHYALLLLLLLGRRAGRYGRSDDQLETSATLLLKEKLASGWGQRWKHGVSST
jgi:hypothetical protein